MSGRLSNVGLIGHPPWNRIKSIVKFGLADYLLVTHYFTLFWLAGAGRSPALHFWLAAFCQQGRDGVPRYTLPGIASLGW